MSNAQCNSNSIKVYDSLKNSRLETYDKFHYQVAALLNCQSTSVTVLRPSVNQQRGSADCGLFAIACATAICFGLAPETQNYIQSEMRSNLAKCFMGGQMNLFPVCPPSLPTAISNHFKIEICFKCRMPKLLGNSLIPCLICNHQYHELCDNSATILFICIACSQECWAYRESSERQ